MKERFISVDIEASGPIPGEYSLLAIGACDVDRPELIFECLLQPSAPNVDPEALAVTGLSLETLEKDGLTPAAAMQAFAAWLATMRGPDETLVFVGFNAAFDWSFINYYFHRYTGANPFGFSALDIKAYYMGRQQCAWSETRSSRMSEVLRPQRIPNHQAKDDAQYQAELFQLMRARPNELS